MKIIMLLMIAIVFLITSCTKVEEKKVVTATKKDSVKVEKNVAQKYIDIKKQNIDNAKASMEKSQKAQEDQKKELDNLLGN